MNIPPVLIEIRPSLMLKGQVGLFSVRDMHAGCVIVSGDRFEETHEPWSAYEALDDETRRKADAFCASTETGIWLPKDFNLLPVFYFMNHSCAPNVGFDKDNGFILLRDVKAGEELCWDYGIGFSDPEFRLECHCGSVDCRGFITGNDWQLPEIQARYDGFFLSELQEKIKHLRKIDTAALANIGVHSE